jgi:serine/threonine protein kinase
MLLEKLKHPNIIGVEERSDSSEAQHPYIVMEYCSGGDLRRVIDGLRTLRYVYR